MKVLISRDKLLLTPMDRKDVDEIIMELNYKLMEAKRAFAPYYLWNAFKLIERPVEKDEGFIDSVTTLPEVKSYSKEAIILVLQELHKMEYNVRLFSNSDFGRIKIEIYWDKVDFEVDEKPNNISLTEDEKFPDLRHRTGLNEADWDFLMLLFAEHPTLPTKPDLSEAPKGPPNPPYPPGVDPWPTDGTPPPRFPASYKNLQLKE